MKTITIIIIIIMASFFRFYGLDWDQGNHLHPDERMITLVADKITFQDPNPHFFAYGSFPIYLLKATGFFAGMFDPQFSTYQSMNLSGRFLSALFDLGTLIILYFLAKKVFNQKMALLSSFFYAVSVLPIQLSHFYAVDTPLTFFILLTLFFLIKFLENPTFKNILLIGISFGLALATKISAVILLAPILISFLFKPHTKFSLTIYYLLLTTITAFIVFLITMPFAFLDFKNFWQQTLAQQAMTKSAFAFPYTLQYVGKIPYLYEIQNIFFWGLGPIFSILAFLGSLLFTYKTFRPALKTDYLTLTTFFWLYFLVVGHFAIGFMRYLLPLYPLLCLFGAILFWQIILFLISKVPLPLFIIFNSLFLILLLVWPLSFISIYSQPNTRVSASVWIDQNIPAGSFIAREHWDDGLPLANNINYKFLELPMYDSDDDPFKWEKINAVLQNTDYMIIASHRLYTPLQKMTDCPNLPPGKCYQKTAQYYQQLFGGRLGFKKVAEFSVYPAFLINDFAADESFTVYDHPKVMIFAKISARLQP